MRFFDMNPIYHPDSLSLVVPSYSRRGVFASQCVKYLDALSQKGSTIETAVEIVRGGGSRAALFKSPV